MNCEGIIGEENVLKMQRVKDVVSNVCEGRRFDDYDW